MKKDGIVTKKDITKKFEAIRTKRGIKVLNVRQWRWTPGRPYLSVKLSKLSSRRIDGSYVYVLSMHLHQIVANDNRKFAAPSITWRSKSSYGVYPKHLSELSHLVVERGVEKFAKAHRLADPKFIPRFKPQKTGSKRGDPAKSLPNKIEPLDIAKYDTLGIGRLIKPPDIGPMRIVPLTSETLLHWSARHGLTKAVAELLKLNEVDANLRNKQKQTPLYLACEGGHVSVVKLLAAKKPNLDERFVDNETMLHAAAWNRHLRVVELLLENQADAKLADDSGYTPLHIAAWKGNVAVAKALLDAKAPATTNENKYTPLHAAAWKGHLPIVNLLILHKAVVDAKDSDGSTPLHKAAWKGHLAAIRSLVEAGADVNAKDNDGFTPLTKAKSAKHKTVIAFLTARGAK